MPYIPEYTDEEKIKRYRARISWAENSPTFKKFKADAEVFVKYYRNKNKVYTVGGQKVNVPTAIKNVDAMFALLTAFEVVPTVQPKGYVTQDLGLVMDAALKNEWDEIKVIETTEPAIKESLVVGFGVAKVGYIFEEEEEEVEEEGDYDPETMERGTVKKTETRILQDRITVEHVPWDEILWDVEAKKWEDVTWVCQKYVMDFEEFKADDSFDSGGVEPDTGIDEKVRGSISKDNPLETYEQRITLYAFYDLNAGTVCWIPKGTDKIVKEQPNPFAIRPELKDRNPFVQFVTRSDINQTFGISDVQVMKSQIDEQNVIRSNLATVVDRWKPKLLAEEGSLTDAGKKAFKSQEWGEVVELTQGRILSNSIQPAPFPSLPQEMWAQDEKARQDSDDAIGINELAQGLLPAGRKTATAMQHMAQASTVRQAEKRNRLHRFYRDIAERILFLMQLMYEQDRITRMVEDYGDVVWEWNNEDITFDVAVGVELESKEIMDSDTRREMGMMLLNLLGTDPNVDQAALKKLVLMRYFRFPAQDVRELIKTAEDAQADLAASAQQQAVQAGAEQGMMPGAEEIPGPLPGTALAQMVNPGDEGQPLA